MNRVRSSYPEVPPLEPCPPAWVTDLVSSYGPGVALFTVAIENAVRLRREEFALRVRNAYLSLASAVVGRGLHPVRFWNFVPRIGDEMGDGLTRYMVFNRGRHAACVAWFGSKTLGRRVATASAVGYSGDDLVAHCLAGSTAGVPVENPRQIPAWQYSRRFGPQPPCFARGTIANLVGVSRLLVGGTASIVGESSTHCDDVAHQTAETLRNITALIVTATGVALRPLDRLQSVRVYIRHPDDVDTIVKNLGSLVGRAEMALAEMCRPELLVEIEGVANLGAAQEPSYGRA